MRPEGALALPADLAGRVAAASFAALLGYPPGVLPRGRPAALGRRTRARYERLGRPWAFARTLGVERLDRDAVAFGGRSFASRRLAARLRELAADRVVVAAVSAGSRVDSLTAELWSQGRPDEAFFLDRFGAAIALELAAWVGGTLRRGAGEAGLGLGSAYAPGHDGWDLSDQVRVARSLPDARASCGGVRLGPLRILESGMIEPRSSLLVVFGLGALPRAAERQWRRHKCGWCSLADCGLRGRERRSAAPDLRIGSG